MILRLRFYFPFLGIMAAVWPLMLSSGQKSADSTLVRMPGKASFYHDSFHGRKTSSGEPYDKTDFTAAHRTLPFNSIVLVTNRKNNRSVVVRINDRGPFVRSRVIDLSRVAAMQLGMVPFGVVPVQVTRLELLEQLIEGDSILHTGDIRDAYGKAASLYDSTLILWSSADWKHAFYMASDLALKDPGKKYLVRANEDIAGKYYELLVTGLSRTDTLEAYKRSGFVRASVLHIP